MSRSEIPVALAPFAGSVRLFDATDLPTRVYFLCEAGEVVYVGGTAQLAKRVAAHRGGGQWQAPKRFDSVFYIPVPRENLASVERAFIRTIKPALNGTHRDADATAFDLGVLDAIVEGPAR